MKFQQWLFKILKKQNVTDGLTDNVKKVYPPQTKFAGVQSVEISVEISDNKTGNDSEIN